MEAEMTRVVIVNAGDYGDHSAEKGSYDSFVEMLERLLKGAKRSDGQPAAEDVSVVRSTDEALRWIGAHKGTIIYVTRGMERDAKKVAQEHSDIRVVVFTGAIPEREVIWVSKWWPNFYKKIEDIVLHG